MKLTPISLDDASFIMRLLNSPGWLQFIGDRDIKSLADAEAYISRIISNKDSQYWVVSVDGSDAGVVTFLKRDYLPYHDIGFAFLPEFQGKGLALQATKTIMNTLKNSHSHLLAFTVPENQKSIQLLIKLGFLFKETIRKDNESLDLYELKLKP